MEGIGVGIAIGIGGGFGGGFGADIAIGIANARETLRKQLRKAIDDNEVSIRDKNGRAIGDQPALHVARQKLQEGIAAQS